MPAITARQAGVNLAHLAQAHDFTLFEYFLTDAAGHKGNFKFTCTVLAEVDDLFAGILATLDLSRALLMTTSDHGNIEETLAKGHTRNPVPTILAGAGHARVAASIASLVDITPAIVEYLK